MVRSAGPGTPVSRTRRPGQRDHLEAVSQRLVSSSSGTWTTADFLDATTGRPSKFLEIFSLIGRLTADSGAFKAADAIINERSLPPVVPHRFTDRISLLDAPVGDLCVEARLNFRAFPPYELRMFALRKLLRMAEGERANPTMSVGMVDRLEAVVIGEGTLECVQVGDGWSCVGT